ncbi:response regulator [Zavarzinia sp. CC-PAN008]|uniref:response regulator n=1 Tax=Zavarzinia sp. CC-PAN008 TaxID=3243332 RepID=UPI003F749111
MASSASTLLDELPRLRRFACLLTGSRRVGDDLLRQSLQAYVAGSTDDLPPGGGVLRLLADLAAATPSQGPSTRGPAASAVPVADEDRLAENLLILPLGQRLAVLLVGVHGLAYGQAARIAGVSEFEIRRDLMAGRRLLLRRSLPPVLVIENERLVGEHIAGILEDMGHRVSGPACTGAEALALARADRPSLILADIDLGDGASGIVVGREIVRLTQAKLIYVTGFPSRVIMEQSRGDNAMVLAKPFAPESLRVAVNRAMVA